MPAGIPDKSKFGDPGKLSPGLTDFFIQKHLAERAGPHYDYRIAGPEGLLSFATKKETPEPGKKISLFPQPLHSPEYGEFTGKIEEGYGKGEVKKHDSGKVFITYAKPDVIKMVVAHHKFPERFNMIRMKDGNWLLHNVTPIKSDPFKKLRFKKIEARDVERLFTPENVVTAKIDGSSGIYNILKDKIEVLSYRASKSGRPILHTERVLGEQAADKLDFPKHLIGSKLRGEIFGTRGGKAISAQELGGMLNATLANSLEKQKSTDTELKNLLFNITQYGKKSVPEDVPHEERIKMLNEIAQYLPGNKFNVLSGEDDPEKQRQLWEDVIGGKNPLTHEGIVAWPKAGGKPTKVKTYPESDVYVRDIYPGGGKYTGIGAGGFKYSLEPEGDIVGEVGTGFSDETREDMLQNPDKYLDRIARIRSQQQFPSGAYRAPAFLALHEDYPMKKESNFSLMAALAKQLHSRMAPRKSTPPNLGYGAIRAGVSSPTLRSNPKVVEPQNVLAKKGEHSDHEGQCDKKNFSLAIREKSSSFFGSKTILKLATEANKIIQAGAPVQSEPEVSEKAVPTGNKRPRMGASRVPIGDKQKLNRRFDFSKKPSASITPWQVGRKINRSN